MSDPRRAALFPPLRLPLPDGTVWTVALLLLAAVLIVDMVTPAALVVGTLLSALVAFALLGASGRATWPLVGLGVLANVIAGVVNGTRDGWNGIDIANRVVSIVAVVLVGWLTHRARQAGERAAQLREDERQLTRERALRQLAQDMGGPLGEAEFVDRAAHALHRLTGAAQVEIGVLERATLRGPHAAVTTPGAAGPSRLGQRLPLEFLARPSGASGERARDVWAADGGDVFLARLRRPGSGDLLIIVTAPASPPALMAEATAALQPLLERTALLDDLRKSRAQLAERGELLRDLVYAFSHDLRTPLMANAMNMDAALRGAYGPLPDDYRATLENGLAANETLLALADQLLLVAKYESGEDDPPDDEGRVNLRDVVLGVVGDLRARAAGRRVTIETDLEGAAVAGRRHDLRRAAQNLLENAVKFSPPGGTVRVTVRAGDDATLTVQDEGPGVPTGAQARLFQRFRPGGAGRGTGLGLYLTRRIAEAHGGEVRYDRTAQARSVFTLTLPLAPEAPYA
ncbi:sensor histidine kinase [Deinococcus yunweiensis]|uniref:sensor histidine kinase n=1 Tax=Deinococcus yunweiensis TaxID=367282 RepID=UPI00398EB392